MIDNYHIELIQELLVRAKKILDMTPFCISCKIRLDKKLPTIKIFNLYINKLWKIKIQATAEFKRC